MIIKDKLLGNIQIENQIIIDLIKTPQLQRLKNISLGSYYPAYPDVAHKANRFEHSVGVFYLLNKFNATLEEQIAGLIHDVSHSAFSHTIDYILNEDKNLSYRQTHQDNIHNEFILNSDICEILNKYNIDINLVLNGTFQLLDNEYPNLCADRIDNGLRCALNIENYDYKNIRKILEGLTVYNNSFVFKNVESAQIFYDLFQYGNEYYWANEKSAVMFFLNKQLFKHALNKGYLSKDDFYKCNDKEVIEKIEKYKDDCELKKFINYLHEKDYKQFLINNSQKNSEEILCKFRRVNPYVMDNKKIKFLSFYNRKIEKDLIENTPQYKAYKIYYN